jgi:hypothetical protein
MIITRAFICGYRRSLEILKTNVRLTALLVNAPLEQTHRRIDRAACRRPLTSVGDLLADGVMASSTVFTVILAACCPLTDENTYLHHKFASC